MITTATTARNIQLIAWTIITSHTGTAYHVEHNAQGTRPHHGFNLLISVEYSAGLTIVADVAIATGPAVLCVKFVFMICKGGYSTLGARSKLSERGPYILHMIYRNIIRWKKV